MTTRQIKTEETDIIRHLLSIAKDSRANLPLPKMIEVLDDGKMGSIKLSTEKDTKYAKDISAIEYTDSDNVLVVITLTEDNKGELFELDFWKTDFAELITYPVPEKVRVHADT